jgi:hypothetical protein
LNTKPTAMKPSNDDIPAVDNSTDDEELDLESLL